MPERGVIDYDQIRQTARTGDGGRLATSRGTLTAGNLLMSDPAGNVIDAGVPLDTDPAVGVLGIVIDGGGSVPATGRKGFLQVAYNCTVTGWTILGEVSGSAQLTVKKSTYAAFPATAGIVGSAPPAVSGAQKATSTTLAGWTTAITAGDILEFNLDSVTTVTRLTLELQVTKI